MHWVSVFKLQMASSCVFSLLLKRNSLQLLWLGFPSQRTNTSNLFLILQLYQKLFGSGVVILRERDKTRYLTGDIENVILFYLKDILQNYWPFLIFIFIFFLKSLIAQTKFFLFYCMLWISDHFHENTATLIFASSYFKKLTCCSLLPFFFSELNLFYLYVCLWSKLFPCSPQEQKLSCCFARTPLTSDQLSFL